MEEEVPFRQDCLRQAVELVQSDRMTLRQASIFFLVSESDIAQTINHAIMHGHAPLITTVEGSVLHNCELRPVLMRLDDMCEVVSPDTTTVHSTSEKSMDEIGHIHELRPVLMRLDDMCEVGSPDTKTVHSASEKSMDEIGHIHEISHLNSGPPHKKKKILASKGITKLRKVSVELSDVMEGFTATKSSVLLPGKRSRTCRQEAEVRDFSECAKQSSPNGKTDCPKMMSTKRASQGVDSEQMSDTPECVQTGNDLVSVDASIVEILKHVKPGSAKKNNAKSELVEAQCPEQEKKRTNSSESYRIVTGENGHWDLFTAVSDQIIPKAKRRAQLIDLVNQLPPKRRPTMRLLANVFQISYLRGSTDRKWHRKGTLRWYSFLKAHPLGYRNLVPPLTSVELKDIERVLSETKRKNTKGLEDSSSKLEEKRMRNGQDSVESEGLMLLPSLITANIECDTPESLPDFSLSSHEIVDSEQCHRPTVLNETALLPSRVQVRERGDPDIPSQTSASPSREDAKKHQRDLINAEYYIKAKGCLDGILKEGLSRYSVCRLFNMRPNDIQSTMYLYELKVFPWYQFRPGIGSTFEEEKAEAARERKDILRKLRKHGEKYLEEIIPTIPPEFDAFRLWDLKVAGDLDQQKGKASEPEDKTEAKILKSGRKVVQNRIYIDERPVKQTEDTHEKSTTAAKEVKYQQDDRKTPPAPRKLGRPRKLLGGHSLEKHQTSRKPSCVVDSSTLARKTESTCKTSTMSLILSKQKQVHGLKPGARRGRPRKVSTTLAGKTGSTRETSTMPLILSKQKQVHGLKPGARRGKPRKVSTTLASKTESTRETSTMPLILSKQKQVHGLKPGARRGIPRKVSTSSPDDCDHALDSLHADEEEIERRENALTLEQFYVILGKELQNCGVDIRVDANKCCNCAISFPYLYQLGEHLRAKHAVGWVACDLCTSIFQSEFFLYGHMLMMHDVIRCHMCSDKSLFSEKYFQKHILEFHQKHSEVFSVFCPPKDQVLKYIVDTDSNLRLEPKILVPKIDETPIGKICLGFSSTHKIRPDDNAGRKRRFSLNFEHQPVKNHRKSGSSESGKGQKEKKERKHRRRKFVSFCAKSSYDLASTEEDIGEEENWARSGSSKGVKGDDIHTITHSFHQTTVQENGLEDNDAGRTSLPKLERSKKKRMSQKTRRKKNVSDCVLATSGCDHQAIGCSEAQYKSTEVECFEKEIRTEKAKRNTESACSHSSSSSDSPDTVAELGSSPQLYTCSVCTVSLFCNLPFFKCHVNSHNELAVNKGP